MEEKTSIGELHWPFKDFELAFKAWNDNKEFNEANKRMVISTHWCTEGYWIEDKDKEINDPLVDHAYVGSEVTELEERVREGIAIAVKYGGNPGLIL